MEERDNRGLSAIIIHFLYPPLTMLVTIAAILIILWLLGLVTSYTLGGFIHLLLIVAVIMILIRLIRGENPIA